ncbi:hypothetical protein LUX05_16850 [Streptomyces somaliensis]|nr:hypothetical protein [Streptomyces somaliensis]
MLDAAGFAPEDDEPEEPEEPDEDDESDEEDEPDESEEDFDAGELLEEAPRLSLR